MGQWLDQAGTSDRQLALEALQILVVATPVQATVSGVIPVEQAEFFTLQQAFTRECIDGYILGQAYRAKVHDQIQRVIAIMRMCDNLQDQNRAFAKVFQKGSVQRQFNDLWGRGRNAVTVLT